jgi:hypothetical protein
MTENGQKHAEVIRQKRGVPVYTTNPSILAKDDISRTRRTRIGTEQRGLVIDGGTGEIFGRGSAYAYEFEEVDKERFREAVPQRPETGLRAIQGGPRGV